jgi:voltage-gated potassium channel
MRTLEETVGGIYNAAVTEPVAQMNLWQKMANRLVSLFIAYLIVMTMAAVMFSVIEGKNLSDGYWWASVTATTVGYGDMFPTHTASKFFGAIFMHICSFIVAPVITAKMAAHMIVDSNAWTHDEQEEMKNNSRLQVQLLQNVQTQLQAITARLDALETES